MKNRALKSKSILILFVLSLMFFVCSFLCYFTSSATAETVNGITFESGASFRAVKDSIGIRFKANVDDTTANTLFSFENDKVVSYKSENYQMGMIIVPSKALDIPKNNIYYETKDYLAYLTDETDGIKDSNGNSISRAKNDLAIDFSFANNNFYYIDDVLTVSGAIIQLNSGNLNYYYQAVIYYTLDKEQYVYSNLSDSVFLADLADSVLENNIEDVNPSLLNDIYGIVADTISMRDKGEKATFDNATNKYSITVNDYELTVNKEYDFSELNYDVDNNISLTNKSGKLSYNNNVLTALDTCAGRLIFSSYNGKINYVYNVKNEPKLEIVKYDDSTVSTEYKIVTDYVGEAVHIPKQSTKISFSKIINEAVYKYKGWGTSSNFFSVITSPNTYNTTDKYIVIGNCAYSRLAGLSDYKGPSINDYKITVKDNSIFVQGNVSSLRFALYQLLYKMIGYERIAFDSVVNYKLTGAINEEVLVNDKDDVVLFKSQLECQSDLSIPINVGFSAGQIYANKYGANIYKLASAGYLYSAELGGGSSYNDDGISQYSYQVRSGHNTLGYFPYAIYKDTHADWYAQKEDGNGGYTVNLMDMTDGLTEKYPDNENYIRKLNSDKVTYTAYRREATQLCFYSLYRDSIAHKNDQSPDYDNDPVDIAMRVIKNYTNKRSIGLSNMDHGGFCNCQHCQNGEFAYWYFMFANEVAKAMKNDVETQDMTLSILVYSSVTNNLPIDNDGKARVKFSDNVSIQFAFNGADFYAGFSEIDRQIITNLNKFVTKAGMSVWLYCVKTSYGMFFFDDFTNMQSKYQFLAENGVTAIEDEGSTSSSVNTNFANLRIYLEGKLAQNVYLDYEELTDHFFDSYFDVASDAMRDVFETQKTLQQTAYANWETLWHLGYDNLSNKHSSSVLNSTGNNLLGTYSASTYHYWVGSRFHGNRYLMSLISPKADLEYMLSRTNTAIANIVNSNVSEDRKSELVSRVLLERLGLIYQYCFIYDDNFTNNPSYQTAQGRTMSASPQVLSQSDLQTYLGCNTLDEVKAMFYQLCVYFGYSSVGYKPLTTDNDSNTSIYTTWDLKNNDDANTDNATWISFYKTQIMSITQYSITYVLNGGTNNQDNLKTYSSNCDEISILDPSREHYTFTGWVEGYVITVGSTGDKTFTATWSPISYSINYILDGGVNGVGNPNFYTVESGKITLNNPTKSNYLFMGWVEGDTILAGSFGEKTFTAIWCYKYDNNGVEYDYIDGNYYVKSVGTFTGSSLELTSTFNNGKVVGILDNAFNGNTTITEITIFGDISSIGNYAFANITNSLTINYDGTASAWSKVIKGTNWNTNSFVSVNCLVLYQDGLVHDGGAWDWN